MSALPQGWTGAYLGDLVTIIRGVSYEKSEARAAPGPELVPILRATNIGERLNFDDLVFVPKSRVSKEQRLCLGDIIVAASSGSRSVVGKAAPLLEPWVGAFGAFCLAIRPHPGVHPRYIAYFMASNEYRNRVSGLAAGVNINNLKRQHIAETPIPLALLLEQERIVEEIEKQFTRLDAGVAALKRLQTHLRRYRAAVLKAACEGRLVPTDAALANGNLAAYDSGEALLERLVAERSRHEEGRRARRTVLDAQRRLAFNLPEGWSCAPLGQIAAIQGGITKGQKRRPDEALRSVPYLRVANVQRGFLDLAQMKTIEATDPEIAELRLRPGDILFNEGGDRDKLGRGWVWNGEIPECIHQNHVFRARPFSEDIQPKFISWYGNSFGQRYFLDEGKQTTNLASINMTKLSALPVPIPPAREQQRIVAEVEKRLSTLDALEASVAATFVRASHLRGAVLRAAFEGRLLTQNPAGTVT